MWKKILHRTSFIGLLLIGTTAVAAESRYEVAFYEAGILNTNDAGIDRDVIAEVQKRTGLKFSVSKKPRARIWHELKTGTLAIATSGIHTPERDQFAWFIPYLTQRNRALLPKSKADRYRSLEEFIADRKAVAGVVRGFAHGERYDEALSLLRAQSRVYETPSINELFSLLNRGNRVDLVFALPVFYQKQITELKIAHEVQILDWDKNGEPIKLCLVVSKKLVAENDVNKLRAAIADMKSDGTLSTIFSRHVPQAELETYLKF